MKEILEFLNQLSHHNQKEWFDQNRTTYESCRNQILFITEVLIQEIRQFDTSIPALNPKECVYRINRDVRFSTDKSPYKTNFGVFISPEGRHSHKAGYFIQIEPGQSFAGGGSWRPPSPLLRGIRTKIDKNPDEFRDLINRPSFRKYYSSIEGEQLKTAPKGFDKTTPHLDLLRYKSYVFTRELSDQFLLTDDWLKAILDGFEQLAPVNRFLNLTFDD